MRLRRFMQDWQLFRDNNWPMIRYESLVADPRTALERLCTEMQVSWDDAMLSWPKPKAELAAPAHGSPTFRATLGDGKNVFDVVDPAMAGLRVDSIPPSDLEWMEHEFADFNRRMGYAEHAPRDPSVTSTDDRAVPRWENTRRYRKSRRTLRQLTSAVTRLTASIAGRTGPDE